MSSPSSFALLGVGGLVTLGTAAYYLYSEQARKKAEEDARKRKLQLQQKEELLRRQNKQNTSSSSSSLSPDAPRLICYYGSQTGTAEGFAKTIVDGCGRFGFQGRVADLEEFDGDSFEEMVASPAGARTVCVFCVATYGEGDPSDNAIGFATYLKQEPSQGQPRPPLQGLRFSVFGLGNRQYEHFNKMGRTVDARLQALGGTRVYPYGEGDDDGTLQEDFNAWMEDLHSALRKAQFGEDASDVQEDVTAMPQFTYESKWLAKPPEALVKTGGRFVESERGTKTGSSSSAPKIDLVSKPYFRTEAFAVRAIRELRQQVSPTSSTMHVELELPASLRTYGTAHNLSIMPENDPAQVEACARALGWSSEDLDRWLSIRPRREVKDEDEAAGHSSEAASVVIGPMIPSPCTLRVALSTACALNATPSRSLISKLALFAQDKQHRAELLTLSSKDGKQELHKQVIEPRLTLQELLERFHSVRFADPANFLELCPRLAPRDYTIASSSKLHPRALHLTVSLVNEPIANGEREFHGVCTFALRRRMEQLRQGLECEPIYAFLKPSSFVLPANPLVPVVLVGPGTGIAPMRALMQERQWLKEHAGQRLGPAALFFGCRKQDEDYIYKDEFQEFKRAGAVSAVHVAFSRQQQQEKKKVYVQDLLKEQADVIWDWVANREGHVYVCGGTLMGKDVHATLVGVAQRCGKMTELQAKDYIARMSTEGRLVQELWS